MEIGWAPFIPENTMYLFEIYLEPAIRPWSKQPSCILLKGRAYHYFFLVLASSSLCTDTIFPEIFLTRKRKKWVCTQAPPLRKSCSVSVTSLTESCTIERPLHHLHFWNWFCEGSTSIFTKQGHLWDKEHKGKRIKTFQVWSRNYPNNHRVTVKAQGDLHATTGQKIKTLKPNRIPYLCTG